MQKALPTAQLCFQCLHDTTQLHFFWGVEWGYWNHGLSVCLFVPMISSEPLKLLQPSLVRQEGLILNLLLYVCGSGTF